MKNISSLIVLLSIAVFLAVAAFLFKEESKYSTMPNAGGRNPSGTTAELKKTEAALHQLEHLHIVGDFHPKGSDDLLSARDKDARRVAAKDENVFPVLGDSGKKTSSLAEALSKNAAQQDYTGSGYTASATISAKNATPKEEVKPPEPHQLSFIYISSDIRRAIVDGAFVQEGETLNDGSQVTAINNDSMTLTKGKKEYSLNIPKSLASYLGPGEKR